MSRRRLLAVFRLDLAHCFRRPLFWILLALLAFVAYGLTTGEVVIASGDTSVGGKKAWVTSEYAVAQMLCMVIFLFYTFFIAVAAGMAVVHDDETRVSELLRSTPLRPSEYVWGKFAAVLCAFLLVLCAHLAFMALFGHLLPSAAAAEVRGPFHLASYLRPALVLAVPTIVFVAGTTFAAGERTRRPILIFGLPVAAVLVTAFFLWDWSPTWLDPRLNRILMLLDPSGFRWLNETWLKVDRGVDHYNVAPVAWDAPFLLSRAAFVGAGLAAVAACRRRLEAHPAPRRATPRTAAAPAAPDAPAPAAPLAALAMRASPPGRLRQALIVAGVELRELRSHGGFYLFVPLILVQTLGANLGAVGAFETKLLLTPGTIAVRMMNTLTLLVCLLLLFYTVESLEREGRTRLLPVAFTAPVRTEALIAGKILANAAAGFVVVLGALAGSVIALLVQGKVALDLGPFAIVWGLLLAPTFFLWTAFVAAVWSLFGNRYTTYAVALAALAATGWAQARDHMTWVFHWHLWSVVRWSDMGLFEVDRRALVLNRALAIGAAVFFLAVAVRVFPRRERDPARLASLLSARGAARMAWSLLPYMIVPAAAAVLLGLEVHRGFEGGDVEKIHEDYWKQNLATWKDARLPSLRSVELDLELDPAGRAFRVKGHYVLVNHHDRPLEKIAMTGGVHWEDVSFTLDGAAVTPEDRSRLYVFTPPAPLPPRGEATIGFAHRGVLPRGISKNGGRIEEFILPSGVVLTSFTPSFVPVLGYLDEIGVDEDNKYEPRVYPSTFHEGVTEPLFQVSASPFTTRIRVSAPAEYTVNSVGALVEERVDAGRRTAVWESDHPVSFFNVVAGRYEVRRGQGTAIFHHPTHTYNLDEMIEVLDASRRFYSEWFWPFPWRELKLSEFPGLAGYAQGFPTNITFSEAIGFLTKSEPKADAVFIVTAHEAAHQWWGNLLVPGKGPGANVVAEGLSHFSALLLIEEVRGPRNRMELAKRLEESYERARFADAERPLVEIDGSRKGDDLVVYDKGGWVFWMLLRHMGRDAALAGLRDLVGRFHAGPDHAVLQDVVAAMRPRAADPAAYEAFARQWFFDVVVPEYRITDAARARAEGDAWDVTLTLQNAGTGRMPVEVAAARGERWDDAGRPAAGYQEARATAVLGAGERAALSIRCPFEPDRLIVDPDVHVLQLRRSAAIHRF